MNITTVYYPFVIALLIIGWNFHSIEWQFVVYRYWAVALIYSSQTPHTQLNGHSPKQYVG